MPVSRHIVAGLLFAASVALMAAANYVAYPMLREVNDARSPHDQYPDSSFRFHFFEIWKEHQRFFPRSQRRVHFVAYVLAAVAFFLTATLIIVLGN